MQSAITFLPGRNELKLGRIDEVQGSSNDLKKHLNSSMSVSPTRKPSTNNPSKSQHRHLSDTVFSKVYDYLLETYVLKRQLHINLKIIEHAQL